MNFFKPKKQATVHVVRNPAPQDYVPVMPDEEVDGGPSIPVGMWEKCNACGEIIYADDLQNDLKVCANCGYHFRLRAWQRILITVDSDTFVELNENLRGGNPLDFPEYDEKLRTARAFTGLKEAVITGIGAIDGRRCVVCAMDSQFMMGSMGAAVGEKITQAVELAVAERLPLIIFTVSGGARMQEGLMSLMQMAKVSAAIGKLRDVGLLYVVVLTDPTTGGVTASFGMLGDITLAEPNATVGFAGRRVIEQTMRQVLPTEFQTSEFVMEKGFIDAIVERKDMRHTLSKILALHEVQS